MFVAHALLSMPFDLLRAWLVAEPIFEERGRLNPDGSLRMTFGVGEMHARAEGDQSALVLECPDEIGLQALRDLVTEEAGEAGIVPVWQERHQRGRPANLCVARVDRVERISPSYRRVWLKGAGLARLLGGGLHFRLLLGPKGADWPWLDENGLTRWPEGQKAWHRPVYTVRKLEGEGAETRVAVDIFLHEGGRVTDWSESIFPGVEVALMGPSGGDVLGDKASPGPWFALFGDETSLPAIARILEAFPASATGVATIRVPQSADIQTLSHPPGMALRWLTRESGGGTLLDALQGQDLPETGRFVFFAAEAEETARARALLTGRGLDKKEIWAQTYWHLGPEPDHHHQA